MINHACNLFVLHLGNAVFIITVNLLTVGGGGYQTLSNRSNASPGTLKPLSTV